MRLRGIIVDDEYLARQRLLNLLKDVGEVDIVAECRNGKEAVERIRLKKPDFVFLDIQMPDMDGFQVLDHLDNIPYVIFTTAYDSFALKAFEINAVDYLLKPFDEERLLSSVERMIDLKKNERAISLEEKLKKLLRDYRAEQLSEYRTYFEIKKNGRLLKIPTDGIVFIKSEGNYLELHSDQGKFLYRETMNTIEAELSPIQFLRIHRSLLINKIYMSKCTYRGNAEYKIEMKTGASFISGRSYKEKVQQYLAESDA